MWRSFPFSTKFEKSLSRFTSERHIFCYKTNITWYNDIEVATSSCTVYHICSISSVILTAIAHLLIQEAIFNPECEIVNILIIANSKRLLIVKSTDSLIGHKVWLILTLHNKVMISINDFFTKCDQISENCGFGYIYWRNPKWKTSFFVQRKEYHFNENNIERSI